MNLVTEISLLDNSVSRSTHKSKQRSMTIVDTNSPLSPFSVSGKLVAVQTKNEEIHEPKLPCRMCAVRSSRTLL